MTYNKIVLCGRSENKDGRPGLSQIGWAMSDCVSATAVWNLTKRDRKQKLYVFIRADRKTNKAAMASDLLRHFWLFVCNRWTEFD